MFSDPYSPKALSRSSFSKNDVYRGLKITHAAFVTPNIRKPILYRITLFAARRTDTATTVERAPTIKIFLFP